MPHALCGVSERIAAFMATDNGNEEKEEQRRMVLLWIGVHSTWHSQIRQRDRCLSKPKVGNLDSGAAGRDADIHHLAQQGYTTT